MRFTLITFCLKSFPVSPDQFVLVLGKPGHMSLVSSGLLVLFSVFQGQMSTVDYLSQSSVFKSTFSVQLSVRK